VYNKVIVDIRLRLPPVCNSKAYNSIQLSGQNIVWRASVRSLCADAYTPLCQNMIRWFTKPEVITLHCRDRNTSCTRFCEWRYVNFHIMWHKNQPRPQLDLHMHRKGFERVCLKIEIHRFHRLLLWPVLRYANGQWDMQTDIQTRWSHYFAP